MQDVRTETSKNRKRAKSKFGYRKILYSGYCVSVDSSQEKDFSVKTRLIMN